MHSRIGICVSCLWDSRAGRPFLCTRYQAILNMCSVCGHFITWAHIASAHPGDIAHLIGPGGVIIPHA